MIFLRSLLLTIQGTYDIVDVVWKLRNLYQGKRWLTWSNYGILCVLRMKV